MKKLLFSIAILIFAGISNLAFSQNENLVAYQPGPLENHSSPGTVPAFDNMNIKARQSFVKTYKNITNETWFPASDGSIANFLLNGKDYRIAYDKNGQWKYTELTYSADKLPGSIREMVKREFYQNDIEYCSEFITSNFKAHIITMKDRETKKVIKVQVTDDQIVVIPESNSAREN